MSDEFGIGWYGKLPSSGDFVFRRLPHSLLDGLDNWMRQGLVALRGAMPNDWKESFATAPAWNCAIPACVTGGYTLIGVMAPSRDRVGREFPICAGVVVPPNTSAVPLLADAHGWLRTLTRSVLEARDRPMPIEVFDASIQGITLPRPQAPGLSSTGGDDILAVLGTGLVDVPTVPMPLAHAVPWTELPMMFDGEKPTSYWWTYPVAGTPLRGFTSEAGLAPSLLVTLVRPLVPRLRDVS